MTTRSNKRAVITGCGPVTSIGIGQDAFARSLRDMRSGAAEITAFDVERFPASFGAEIVDFDVRKYLKSEKTYLDRGSELAFAAAQLAMDDAGLNPGMIPGGETALLMGTAYGNLASLGAFFNDFLKKGPRLVKPILFPHTYSNTTISLLAIEYGLSGYHVNFSSGGVSSSCAIAAACDLIRQGRAKIVLAGGFETLNEILYAGLSRMGVLVPKGAPTEGFAPFDRQRRGFVPGEGAGMLVIEERDSARARGARIRGEIIGAGLTSDSSVDSKDGGAGIQDAMTAALRDAGLEVRNLDAVMAHANGSPRLDAHEGQALARLLGPSTSAVPVTSIKPMTGELSGASGVTQVMAALAALESGFLPPILHLKNPEEGLNLDLVMEKTREKTMRRVLVNSIDAGGSSASLLIQNDHEG